MGMKVKDIDALREQISKDPREAFTKHQVWLFASEHNKTVPTVEAIPKDQYEARLKADIAAMLIDLKLEIEESPITDDGIRIEDYSIYERGYEQATLDYSKMIQQKINALKGNTKHWIDDADHWICPDCGFITPNPNRYAGCKCPKCGFQDEKDKAETEAEDGNVD